MKIKLTDVVSDTYTNTAGYMLNAVLKSALAGGNQILLSFSGASAPSSSFLNSSFGNLIEEMGLDNFLSLVKPSEVIHTQANMLKHYIQGFRSGAEA